MAGGIYLRASEWVPKRLARGYRGARPERSAARRHRHTGSRSAARASPLAGCASEKKFGTGQKHEHEMAELYKQGVVSQLDAENTATSQGTNKANTEAFAANL